MTASALVALLCVGVMGFAIQRAMHIHPTVSELIPTLLGSLTEAPTRP